MDVDSTGTNSSAYWWWKEDGGARFVVVAYGCLVFTGILDSDKQAQVDNACRRGHFTGANFGTDAVVLDLSAVRAVRFVPSLFQTILVESNGSRFVIAPPGPDAPMAEEIFTHLTGLLAPGETPREGFVRAPRARRSGSEGKVAAVMGLVAVSVLAVAAWADPDRESTGPLGGLIGAINDFFVSIGWLAVVLVLAGLLSAEATALVRARAATSRRLAALQVDPPRSLGYVVHDAPDVVEGPTIVVDDGSVLVRARFRASAERLSESPASS